MPALICTVSVNPTVMLPNQQGGNVSLVIQNNTTSAATITSIQPLLSGAGASSAPINMGSVPYGQGLLTSVGAGATVNINYGIVPFGPNNRYQGGSPGPVTVTDTNPGDVQTASYTIGALVQTSDGVISSATPQTLQVVYTPSALPVLPLNGQLRFESNVNSAFLGVL